MPNEKISQQELAHIFSGYMFGGHMPVQAIPILHEAGLTPDEVREKLKAFASSYHENRLRELAQRAKPGPWFDQIAHWGLSDIVTYTDTEDSKSLCNGKPYREVVPYIDPDDAALIAMAVNYVRYIFGPDGPKAS